MQMRFSHLLLAGFIFLAICVLPAHADIPTGSILINSDPGNAEVYITKQFRGYTPLTIHEHRAGMTRIRLTKPGYQDWNGVAYVVPGERVTVNAVLVRTRTQYQPYGSIMVTADQGADVFLNNNYAGQTDADRSLILARADLGTHLITVTKEGYHPYSQLVEVHSAKTSGVAVDMVHLDAPEEMSPPPATPALRSPVPTPPEESAVSPAVLFCGILLAIGIFMFIRRI
ncbi:MAG: PEGA domain-containing protein [Methanocalculus sp. MSAO_Arc2]|uniref:PEGA domain-containing protein n=1 Tax=Methanocalculus sp. MSAO_Arc2 TaxID=2293855 RepID=UPI000FEF0582|nr:MAG: PEGA domain-containing protein [Methanocalculus sp. MSAO_Arc2]